MYEKLKTELPRIVEICESVPEHYKDRCFEVLLTALVSISKQPSTKNQDEKTPEPTKEIDDENSTSARRGGILPAKLRAILTRMSISEDDLDTLVLLEDGEVHFLCEPISKNNAADQITWSLLLALATAMIGKDLAFDPEAVRSKCINKDCYDKANFASNFKKPNVKKLFLTVPRKHGDQVKLSPEGEKELGETLKKMLKR